MVGLAAYVSIPTVHKQPVVSRQDVWVQKGFPVQAGSLLEQPRNITLFSDMTTTLKANLTVLESGGASSSIHFELLSMNKTQNCFPSSKPPSVLLDRTVSNQSLSIPLGANGTYCFVFDNQGSQTSKVIDISARVSGTSELVRVARDGSANAAGLALGAVGLAVAAYGYSRKTIIPWE
jgi:hypothetical protein